ncbi:unnamed protein product [Cuscuta epithymum]|uniref:Uncharacterized protein n=1 Tax=Cuscuta epithymum TaxID=186058 RepID=A0AAV0FH03_9ASTE|nr:unnamed protein product [Cuscuta epithymum]
MDPKAFAKLSKQLAKDEKKKKKEGPSTQAPVDSFFKKDKAPEGQGPSQEVVAADAGTGAGGSQAGELKRKNAGKGIKPPEKKKSKGDVGQKAPPVVIIDDPPASQPSAFAPLDDFDEGAWPLETVQFPIKKGTALMHGTLDPREFLRGATPPLDRSTLSRFGDETLELKALQASATASVAFGELVRRAEQHRVEKAKSDEAMRKLIANNTEAIRQLAALEETLRQAEQKLEAARQEAWVEGKAEAERIAVEAAKTAADAADVAKREAVADAAKGAIDAFKAGGWRTESHQEWMASVVPELVEEWVKGPGAMWLARKGKSFYEGGQYFTQAMLYRRLARHLGMDPKEFKPETHGFPLLVPDIRIPLPEGKERQLLEDSELDGLASDDDEDAEDDVTSKPKDEGLSS